MNKRIIFSPIIFCLVISLNNPVRAQWDLNGTQPDVLSSASAGTAGNTYNGATGQPYLRQAAAGQGIMPNNQQTQYNHLVGNQSGYLNNAFGQTQNTFAQANNQQLFQTSNPALSSMQNQGPLPGIPSGVKGILNGLPPTNLDSFVSNAGGKAEAIYGDEGTSAWPPLNGFGTGNTINAGIVGQRNKTITTGHGGSLLPTASGNGQQKAP